ncbi:MAG: YwiC-like family protein [Candidatus Promineifilaceae bacterium]|nr:YwiC-like family protein [Candidatus Promineifilaceae bacterium]
MIHRRAEHSTPATTPRKRRSLRQQFLRRSLIIPVEHGSWCWLLVPLLVGVGVGVSRGAQPGARLSVLLLFIGGLSVFLLRQPATTWLRIRRGRGRRSDRAPAAVWTTVLALLSFLALSALLLLGRQALLWLFLPVLVLLLLYVGIARSHRAGVRALWMELAGAGGLALMAPAGYGAVTGALDRAALLLGLLMALQNTLSVLYVRLRLADRYGRKGKPRTVVGAHLLGFIIVALAAVQPHVPWAAALPFATFLARAWWAASKRRPLANIKRFGFTEVAVHLSSGLWIMVTFSAVQ